VVRFPVDKVAVVPEILPHVKLSNDDCHWILPALPVKVIVLPVPEHTDEDIGVAVPPTEAGVTVTVVSVEFTELHTPLWTTALNWVVAVKVPEV